MKMGETNKQVRVDNWGVFFLQRLQVFFNKTDYCDLTLQFEGNVQLKVHRLVMSACTEYFSILEHTCEVIDGNTIIMPDDLQADVILPIVNFMYTGMLEFPMSIFDKLYRTAELMNIPILVKLLDAQRKPVKNIRKQSTWQSIKKPLVNNKEVDLPTTLPGRKLPVWKRKSMNTPPLSTGSPQLFSTSTTESITKRIPPDPLALYDNTPKPTRFEWPEEELSSTFNLIDTSFNDISYTSKPLLTQDDELRASTSFDDIKYSSTNSIKKSKEYTSNIDINDVKDYVKEQKIRSDLGEYEEEDEDDPDNYLVERDNKRKLSKEQPSPTHAKRVRFTINEKENKEMTISVTPKNPGEMDHTKIISEVLKKYPHLVKKNKNIKLKIMAKTLTKEPTKTPSIIKPLPTTTKLKVVSPKESPKPVKAITTKIVKPQTDEGPWVCTKCSFNSTEPVEFVLYYLYRKHMTDIHHEKFDSKMCKHCGHRSSKHNLLMYHQYIRHGIKPPPAYNFPKCARCPFIALTENLLQKHLQNVHSKCDLQCAECMVAFNSQSSLLAHIQITGHSNSGRSSFDCQYCTKRINSATVLFSHIRSCHRDEARRDGMVSIDEIGDMDEDQEEEEEEDDMDEFMPREEIVSQTKKSKKVEVVSNVKISDDEKFSSPIQSQTEPGVISTEVITDMDVNNQGIVDIVVLDENQQYILHNDQQLVHTPQGLVHSQPEYILPEINNQHEFAQGQAIGEVITTSQANVITQSMLHNSEIASTDELVMVLTDHDYNDANNGILTNENSNIVVLYSHPVDGQQNEFITSEGKLILNPQTGLLEIRNENNDSQDTQIESIELIQREINNGLIQQNAVEMQRNQNVAMAVDNVEEVDDKSGILNQVDAQQYNLPGGTEEVEQNTKILDSSMEEPMEIDETCNVREHDLNDLTGVENDQEISTENIGSNEEIIHHQQIEEDQVIQELVSNPAISENKSVVNEENITENLLEGEVGGNEELPSDRIENIVEEMTEETPVETHINNNQELSVPEDDNILMTNQEDNTKINAEQTSEIQQDASSETINHVVLDSNTEITSEVQQHEITVIAQEHTSETQQMQPDDAPTEIQNENSSNTTSSIHHQANPEFTTEPHQELSSESHESNPGATSETYDNLNPDMSPEMQCEESPEATALPSDIQHDLHPEEVCKVSQEIRSENTQFSSVDEEQTQTSAINEHTEMAGILEQSQDSPSITPEPNIPSETIDNLSGGDRADLEMSPKETSNQNIPIEDIPMPSIVTEDMTVQNQRDMTPIHSMLNNENASNMNYNDEVPENMIVSNEPQSVSENLPEQQMAPLVTDQVPASQISTVLTERSDDVNKQIIEDNTVEQINFEPANNQQLEETSQSYEDLNILINENVEQGKPEIALDQEESIVNSSSIEYEINKETMDIEVEGSIDENSQSQDSQTSQSSKEVASDYDKHVPNESTKISILNDWEDTEDSQQSDNPAKNIENTVNKLIDDWDDDDDEGQTLDT